MSTDADTHLLDVLLDSWDRSNTILLGLLRALPPGGLDARATADGPTVAALFAHIHYVRLVFVLEDAPEYAREVPREEWAAERDPVRLERMLAESAAAVREAVQGQVAAGRAMELHYDHPILLLQHMIWHEGYHHGQVKLALKLAGSPLADEVAGPVSWDIWMDRRSPVTGPPAA